MTFNNKSKTVAILITVLIFMSSLVYFSVPLYKIFCNLTGFQGFNEQSIKLDDNTNISKPQLNFNVIFTSQVDAKLDWMFEAPKKMIISEGVKYDVIFKAKNNTSIETTGTSIFNVLPPKIGPYLMKIECFCFLDQTILPNETVEYPVILPISSFSLKKNKSWCNFCFIIIGIIYIIIK